MYCSVPDKHSRLKVPGKSNHMSKCIFSSKSCDDLSEIHDYIAEDDPFAADNLISLIEEKCRLLASSPGIGRACPQFGPTMRSFPIGKYIIFYDRIEDGIEIIHIFHAKRDIGVAFRRK